MAIRGQTKNIGLPPIGFKGLDVKENFTPFQIDLRNGIVTDAGNWKKRNGYGNSIDLSNSKSVNLLFDELNGVAVTDDGKLYKGVITTPVQMTGASLNGTSRPQWVWGLDSSGDRTMFVVDGGTTVKISTSGVTSQSTTAPSARFIGRVGPYTLYSGLGVTRFDWSASNNSENITTGDSGFTNVKKTGTIQYARDFRNKWIVFKDNEIEIWQNRGGTTPFVRLNESTIPIGLGASYSVVEANQILYFMDTDKKFRVINGNRADIISGPYESYLLDKIQNPGGVYGFNFEKEHSIRWFSPVDGICLKYDYQNQFWAEDNHYEHGQYERLPINSYMELDGKQYIGDYNPTGLVYEWSSDNKDDNGTPIRSLREFKVKLSERGHLSSVNRLRLMLKRGINTLTETNPRLLVRWRFDEDAEDVEWRTATVELGTDSDPYKDIFGLGLGRIIHFQFIDNDAVDYLLLGASLTVSEMGI